MTRQTILPILLAATLPIHATAADEGLFPFTVAYDAGSNVTNVSSWLERPAGKHGFVRVEDGRMVTDAGPIRFWGTNLCFEACFPSHEQSERVAARMARFGINCVRMHHMDSRSIWGDSPNRTTIDPEKLDRLDYLIHQLKRHGIYTNLNLHVSRTLGPADGFPAAEGRPTYDKGLGNFEPQMIALQRKYARDLLAHVNPYIKTAYAHEPAVAMVEISNEDALHAIWGWGQLDELPEPYTTKFRKLWNRWLREKHGNSERLRKAWNVGRWPLGDEMLSSGDFSGPIERQWNLERDEQTRAEMSIQREGPENSRCLRIVVTRSGSVAWRPQLTAGTFALKKGTPYTLTCLLRADKQRSISINCMMAHDPWERLGFSTEVKIGTQWTSHRFTFVAERDDTAARLTLSGLKPGTYELAQVSLRPGGIVGLKDDQRIEDDMVPWLRRGQLSLTEAARADFADFLVDIERDYWWGMQRFLKEDLGVESIISGTQLSYSPVRVQAGLDYIDAHSYWKHPSFPGRPWDSRNWRVHNVALVNSPGAALAGLANRRVAGMAFTVSEYNHPAPNVYAAEGFPMLAAFAAFQSWDGIFPFTYSHNADFEPGRITGFFDVKGDTQKLVHMPACAAMFLRGDVAAAEKTVRAAMSPDAETNKLRESLSAWTLTADHFGVDKRTSLVHGVAIDIANNAKADPARNLDAANVFLSDTGQLRWDVSLEGAGYFTADSPRTKLFTGFVAGRTFQLGRVTLKIGKTRSDWATISMVVVEGQGFDGPGRILIAATGWVQNTGAKLQYLADDRVTLDDQWGASPVLCEGIPAEVTLPVAADRVSFYPLDESGNRRAAVECRGSDGKTILPLDPSHRTVWYEVRIH